MATERGVFVVLEGLDGAGTTTQGQVLAKRLAAESGRAHFTAEPSSGPIGTQIRQILAGRLVGGAGGGFDRRALALLFAADRLDHVQADVEPKLAAGIHVVCDRYVLSSLAYQALDAEPSWVAELNRLAPPPDLTLFLRVRPEVALRRRTVASHGAAELFEKLPLQRRIAKSYERDLVRHGKRHRAVVIDGERSVDDVSSAIWTHVQKLIARKRRPSRR